MDLTKEFEKNDFVHWFIIAALSGIEITDNITSVPRNITMQINGEEVNPKIAIERLENQFEKMVEVRAKGILKERMSDIMNPFEDKIEELINYLERKIES